MYDYEQMRAYNMPESDGKEYARMFVRESRVPMDLCDKLIATAVVAGLAVFFSGATYFALESVNSQKERYEQQQREHYQKSNDEKEILRGR